ncbi:LacI family DNA-binding transcriptional regulator [Companilactobacillus paralimentarius]|uniref:LacI family DNA-binding transcriptional regulator n=1 Tax=Companilactobacillus paralimentarius TaxID=83526 RepID=UPI00384AABA1
MSKKINAYQVAKLAHVSPATVSRVLNHRASVSVDTAEKVDIAINKLGFGIIDNNFKRNLVILNVPELSNLFYTEIIEGTQAAANVANLKVLIDQTEISDSTINEFVKYISDLKIFGLILLNQLPNHLLKQLSKVTRVVQCCEYNIDSNLPSVSIDDFSAAKLATSQLVATGKTRLAILNGPSSFKYSREREHGFKKSLEENNLIFNDDWNISLPAISYEIAYPIVSQMFNSKQHPNAFFCVSDTLGAAVISAAKKFNLRIPQDIAVIGFDNTVISKVINPALTTINQPKFQEGYSAIELLRNNDNIKNHLFLKTELIVRETTI